MPEPRKKQELWMSPCTHFASEKSKTQGLTAIRRGSQGDHTGIQAPQTTEPTLSEVTSYTALGGNVQRKEGPHDLDVGRRKGDSLGCT